jgi:hypothetical protein
LGAISPAVPASAVALPPPSDVLRRTAPAPSVEQNIYAQWFAMVSLTRPKSSGPHRLAPDAPVATLPRTHGPLIPDQEALCAFAHPYAGRHLLLSSIANF